MASISALQIGRRIRELREERGFSQDDLGKALGLHRQAISLMEQGKRDLTAMELDAFTRFLQVSYDAVLGPPVRKTRERETVTKNFKPEKLRALLLLLLEEVGGRPNVGETVLYKLLYFCDFDHYEHYGHSMSGMTYRRLQFGPVPQQNQYEPVIGDMIQRKELQKFEHSYYDMVQIRYLPLCDSDRESLDAEECATVKRVAGRLGHMNARQIEDYVHGDAPWEATAHQQPIDYELVHWRTEPYALHTEKEVLSAFEQAAANDSEARLEPTTKDDYDYYMSLPDLPDDSKKSTLR